MPTKVDLMTKQLVQDLGNGAVSLLEGPRPRWQRGSVRVQTLASVVSPGTERLIAGLASKSLIGKAKARPDLVRKVLDKARRDGPMAAFQAVNAKLGEPAPVGYSSAGRVLEADPDGPASGSLVACAGAGYATHAQEVVVPRNLVVPVPPSVSAEEAAFVALGAISLQSVRILRPELGEQVVVVGLGPLGLFALQMLTAAGCKVLGIDLLTDRAELAEKLGASATLLADDPDLVEKVMEFTHGWGADAVLVAASSPTSEPMAVAGEISRDRGRVVVLGHLPTEFSRDLYYAKELEVRLSRSYGPGRYDPDFEERGGQYPRGYIRFTETENMRTFLDLVASGRVNVKDLIAERVPLAEVPERYQELLRGGKGGGGIVITYPEVATEERPAAATPVAPRKRAGGVGVGFIGAGAFARSVLLPAFKAEARLRGVATQRGSTAASAAQAFGIEQVFDSAEGLLADPECELAVVATRHGEHARLSAQVLESGKHVFCEKPLAIDLEGLRQVEAAMAAHPGKLVHVGFNRRFAVHAKRLRELRDGSPRPAMVAIRVNAGMVPAGHWTTHAGEGGGRLIGEGCHFIDLARYLTGAPIRSVHALGASAPELNPEENFTLSIDFEDGSTASIVYTAIGDSAFGKERVELFAGGAVGLIDDFGASSIVRGGRTQRWRGLGKDKGHKAQVKALLEAVQKGGLPPIPTAEILEVTRATLAARLSLQTGRRTPLRDLESVSDELFAADDAA